VGADPDGKIPFPKGVNMSAAAVRILVVGNSAASTESTLKGLARSGWESHAVESVCEANAVLRTIRFQLTLAAEKLCDGTGYELAGLIEQQRGYLFISVHLSETCLWLPVVEGGVRSLGKRALNPLTLATEAEFILRMADEARTRRERERVEGAIASRQAVSTEAVPARRAAPPNEAARFGSLVRERYEPGEKAAPRSQASPQTPLPRGASTAAKTPLPLTDEGAANDVAVAGKRWREI
jgi:hypothetical protein